MAQFDVHANLGRDRGTVPYPVVVQSRKFDHVSTRVVVPMVRSRPRGYVNPSVPPLFQIGGEELKLDPLLIFTAPASRLGPVVASLAADEHAARIIAALDAVITQAFG